MDLACQIQAVYITKYYYIPLSNWLFYDKICASKTEERFSTVLTIINLTKIIHKDTCFLNFIYFV